MEVPPAGGWRDLLHYIPLTERNVRIIMELEPKLLELLRNRGIESEEDIREFLSDKPRRTLSLIHI